MKRLNSDRETKRAIHEGSLFRSHHERSIDRQFSQLDEPIKTEIVDSNTNLTVSHESLAANPLSQGSSFECLYSGQNYNHQLSSAIPTNSSPYSSGHTSPTVSPYASPYHKPSVDNDFRLLPTPQLHRSSQSLQNFRNCYSLDSESSPYTLQVPSRSSSSHSLEARRSSTGQIPETQYIRRSSVGQLPDTFGQTSFNHADSLPNLSSSNENSNFARTYIELQPASSNFLSSLLSVSQATSLESPNPLASFALQPSTQLQQFGATPPTQEVSSHPMNPSITVTPPAGVGETDEDSSSVMLWSFQNFGSI